MRSSLTSIACLSIYSADTNSTGRDCNNQTGFVFLVGFDFNIVSLIRNHVTLITQHVGNRAFVFQTGLDHVKAGMGRGEYIEKQGAIYGHKTREYISALQFFNITRCSRSDAVTDWVSETWLMWLWRARIPIDNFSDLTVRVPSDLRDASH